MNSLTKRQLKRFGNLIRILHEVPEPQRFTMRRFIHPCGMPTCVLGHYAARQDVQHTFTTGSGLAGTGFYLISDESHCLFADGKEVCAHFGLKPTDANELFGPEGCNKAVLPDEAAAYIENFLEEKLDANQTTR